MDITQQQVKLPEEVGKQYDLKKQIPVVIIAGIGRVDFTKIGPTMAEKVVKQTGDKYLVEKVKTPAPPIKP